MEPSPSDTLSDLCQRYLQAQLRGDRREALRLVQEGIERGASVQEVRARVIRDAQLEIGRLWQENRISIAQEHQATAISQVALARLYERADPKSPLGKRVVVACVEGELHDFPARLAADTLDLEGFTVHFLGASVPTESLLLFLEQERVDLLALSVTMSFNVPALREAVAQVRARFGDRLPVVVGGHALGWDPGLAGQLDVQGAGADADALLAAAHRALAGAAR